MADTDAVREITEKLETGVKGLFESDKYADYLKTMSRFHRYSTRNTLLIHLQMPGATHVTNLNAWENKFSRQVKEGERERGIKILTPTPYVNNRELDKTIRFGVTNVYDLSQTVGKPLPALAEPLTGSVAQYELFMDALRAVSPLPIVFEPFDDDKEGLCRYGVAIALREGMSEIQTVSAGIHEITHAKLHSEKQKDKRTEEVEAESVSYAVCQYYGIDTGANAFGYIVEWSRGRDLIELNASLDTIRKTAAELIDGIDRQFLALSIELGKRVLSAEPQREAAKQSLAATVNAPEMIKTAPTKETLEAKYNTAFEFFVGALCANKELLAVAATGAGWQKGAGRAAVFDGGHFEKLIDTYGSEFADVFADKQMATRLNNTVRGEAYRRLDTIAYNRYILDDYADITKSGRLDTYETPYPEESANTGILVHLTEQLPNGGVHDYGYIYGYDPDDTREHTINEYLSLKSFAELRESVFGKPETRITLNYKESEPVGSTVLRRLLYTDGMFNRELKRTRVDVLPPMGKYSVYAQHLKGVIGDDTLIHVGTDSGYLLPLGVSRTRFEEQFVEAQIESIFEKAPVLLDNALAEPEQYARYEWGAVTGRFSEIEEHNAPIRKLREEKDRLRHEEAVKAEKEEQRQKAEKYDARVDVIATAIEQGKSIPVGYNEHEFDGKNPVLDLFKLYGIELPLRTQGWVNTGLAEISESGYRYYSSKHKGNSTAFSGYFQKLREAIKAEPIGVKRERFAEQNSESKNGGEDMQYSELQEKGFEYARNHAHLPLDERLNIIAKTFDCKTASVEIIPCGGKYRGYSDITLTLDNGAFLGFGMYKTAQAKDEKIISECVNNLLARYNPEILSEIKARAAAALSVREAEDNAIAAEKGLKPYTFLTVELNNGRDGYAGWYNTTLAVDGNIFAFVESGLNSDITRGVLSEKINRPNFFIAGGIKHDEVDFVFDNVGHSSFNGSHQVVLSENVRQRAEKRLNELTKKPAAETAVIKTLEQQLYDKFADMFPQFMSGEYNTLRLEAEYAKPLTLEWVFGDWISISHTYERSGEPAYEPMVMLSINSGEKTMTARSLDLSEPPRHDVVYRNDDPPDLAMQRNINNFTAQWLDRAEKQGFKPVEATIDIDGEDVRVTFDKDGNIIMPEPEKSSESFEVTVFTYEDGGYDALAGVFDNKQDAEAFACLLKNDGYYSVGLKAIVDGEEYPITISMPLDEAQRNAAAVALFNKTEADAVSTPEEKPRNLPGYSDDGEFIRQFAILNKYVKDVSAELKANDVTFTFAEGYTDYLTFFVIPNEADAVKCRDALSKLTVENLFGLSEGDLRQLIETAMPKVTMLDLSQPDPSIGFSEMNLFGYTAQEMLPLLQGRAAELFDTNHCVYLLYPDNTEAMALDRGEILNHDGLCGIERADWERSPVYAAQMAIAANAEGKREADLLYGGGNRFGIYQIKDGIDAARDFRFAPMRELEALGLTVDRANYELVYTAPFSERVEFLSDRYPVLNRIYEQFNVNQPADYAARSVSVSDVIVLKYNGDISSHFVDSAGIVEIDGFLGEESHREAAKREAERTDPTYSQVGNSSSAPTAAGLEADAKAGKIISLTDMINAQKNGRRSPSPKGKPSLLGTLERNKQKAARQGQPNAAKKDGLEV